MTAQDYLIEAMEPSGRWYILGSSRSNGDAQDFMREHRKLFAKLPLRVVENPSRKLMVLHDPRDPDPTKDGIFRDHNCWRCGDGKKPCVQGDPHRCEFPHARND